jgi:putative ABC transport system substrate-binding protein
MRIGHTSLIAALVLGLFARSLSAVAQQPEGIARLGILSDETSFMGAKSFEPFAQGLRDLGYGEGRNIAFEQRYAGQKYDLLPSLAAELVGLRPDVILAIGTPATRAAKSATQTIPIVFARIGDPVGMGLVPTLARPGGNLTGVSILTKETGAKRLELLIAAVPSAKRVGVLWNPSNPMDTSETEELKAAARILNLELLPAEVRSPDDFEPALRAIVEHGAAAAVVVGSVIFLEHWQQLADLTAKTRLPAMFNRREFVEAGGLMSFGTNFPGMYRRAAAYVDKILKGAKPADLPVEQPTKFELVVNLKTAKALGLAIPQMILLRAEEVIE